MIASLFLSFREGLEAALIIGIVLAALGKMNRKNLRYSIWQGTVAAVVLSIFIGLGLAWLGAKFEGRAEKIFDGTAMLTAAALLTWMIIWLQQQTRSMQQKLETGVEKASKLMGSRAALFGLSFLAVGREGLELVLFLTAIRMTAGGFQTLLGTILGLAVAIAFGWVIFISSKRLSLRKFFSITNFLLVLFAAGLVAHAVQEFNEAGIIPVVIEHVWNINMIVYESKPLGQLLAALFGYNANPSLTEILAYGAFLLTALIFWISRNSTRTTAISE
ncbi:MAG: FTR1 family protein [Anaerolineaceae bacterium]